jgi:hypothetical protein
VVVPTYNERENVQPLVHELVGLGLDLDVWVADDGSPDGTGAAVKEAMAELPGRVQLLERSEKGGRGAAVIAAFKQGLADPRHYDVLFEMNADFSHHPREIPKFLKALETHDMVIGSRYVPGGSTADWGVTRTQLSKWANKYIGLVAGVPVARGAGVDRVRPHQDQGLRGARRDGVPGLDPRLRAGRGADPFQEPRTRREQADGAGDLHGARELRAAALPLRVPPQAPPRELMRAATSVPSQKRVAYLSADASRLAALLLGCIYAICAPVAPCDPGASALMYATYL